MTETNTPATAGQNVAVTEAECNNKRSLVLIKSAPGCAAMDEFVRKDPNILAQFVSEGLVVAGAAFMASLGSKSTLLQPSGKWDESERTDAVVYGDISHAPLDHVIAFATVPAVNKTEPEHIKNHVKTIGELINSYLVTHRVGPKEGDCFLIGQPDPGAGRSKTGMAFASLAIVDVDDVEDHASVRQTILDRDLFCIAYTTHSHNKTETFVAEDDFHRWQGSNALPVDGTGRRYLLEKLDMRPAIVAEAEYVNRRKQDGKAGFVFWHAPIAKWRYVFPLARRFVFMDRPCPLTEAYIEWEERGLGLGKMLGVKLDESGTRAAQPMYRPRHPVGRNDFHIEVLAGRVLLDIESVERVTRKEKAPPLRNSKLKADGGYATKNLPQFMLRYQSSFQGRVWAERRLEHLMVDGQGHFECPNRAQHTEQVDGSTAFIIWDAAYSSTEKAKAFCHHAHCKLDNWIFWDMLFQEAGVSDAMDLLKTDGDLVGKPDAGCGEVPPVPFDDVAHARSGIENADPATADIIARRIGASMFSDVVREMLRNELSARVGIGKTTLAKAIKAGLEALQKAAKAEERAAKANEAARKADAGEWTFPGHFYVATGKVWREVGTEEMPDMEICSEFKPVGLLRDEDSTDWKLAIAFTDADGITKERTVSTYRLHTEGSVVAAELARDGLGVVAMKEPRDWLATLLGTIAQDTTLPRVLEVKTPGWHRGDAFHISPLGEVNGEVPAGETVRLADGSGAHSQVKGGTLEGHRAVLAAAFDDPRSWHYALGACAGFVGAAQSLLTAEEGGGFIFVGGSGLGKTTSQELQAGVWANPKPSQGMMHEAKGSANGKETLARNATGSTLALNECQHLDPKDFAATLFMLGGGAGSVRMKRSADGNRPVATFKVFATLSSEKTPRELVAKTGEVVAGLHARFPSLDIGAVPVLEKGCDLLKRLDRRFEHFGWAGPEFVRGLLTDGFNTVEGKDQIRNEVDKLTVEICASNPAAARGGRKLAWVRWAGEKAVRYGLLPETADVAGAVAKAAACFLEGESAKAFDGKSIIDAIRQGVAREWGRSIIDLHALASYAPPIGWHDEETIFILKDHLGSLAGSHTASTLPSILFNAGLLIPKKPNGRQLYHEKMPVKGKLANYRLRMSAFKDTDGPDEAEGTDAPEVEEATVTDALLSQAMRGINSAVRNKRVKRFG